MVNSGSQSSLATWKTKASKYQTSINLISVLLMLVGILIIGQANDLYDFYHLPKLRFWCKYFVWFPTSLLSLGILLFVSSVYSIAVSTRANSQDLVYRTLVSIIAVLYTVAFVGTIFVTYCSIQLGNTIKNRSIPTLKVKEHLEKYGNDTAMTESWDQLQQEMRCCGGISIGTEEGAYTDWENINQDAWNTGPWKVPTSCCINPSDTCGDLADPNSGRADLVVQQRGKFWRDGCVAVIELRVKADLGDGVMWYYALGGVVVALLELVATVLACAYIATLNRRVKRSNTMQLS